MPFNNIISRADALPLIPEDIVDEVIKAAAAESAALSLFRRVNMGTKLTTLPVLSALAQAYFVNGDTGLKQTTEMAWAGVTLEAEELAAIVPVPEAVVDDADFDLWGEVQPGSPRRSATRSTPPSSPAPTSPRPGRRRSSRLRSQREHRRASPTAPPSRAASSATSTQTLDAVEDDGYDATGIAAERALRGLLRKRARHARAAARRRAAAPSRTCRSPTSATACSPRRRSPSSATTRMAVLGLRQDLRSSCSTRR